MQNSAGYAEALLAGLPLIGTPIRQVKTPRLVNERLQQAGIAAEMIPVTIEQSQVDTFFTSLRASKGALGCSVTIPHKIQAHNNMDEVTDRAKRLGVVNTVRRKRDGRLVGDITDGTAMKNALLRTGAQISGSVVLIVGAAGGAGRAIADAFAEACAAKIILIDPNKQQLELMANVLSYAFPSVEFIETIQEQFCDTAINASPLGMKQSDELPIDLAMVRPGGAVCDAVTADPQSRLINQARAMGFMTADGRDMAACQIDQQLSHWGVYDHTTRRSSAP